MLIARVVAILGLIAVGGCLAMAVLTRDRRYLRAAFRVFQFALVFLAVFLVLYLLERLLRVA